MKRIEKILLEQEPRKAAKLICRSIEDCGECIHCGCCKDLENDEEEQLMLIGWALEDVK